MEKRESTMRPATLSEVFHDWDQAMIRDVWDRVQRGMAWLDEHHPEWFDRFWPQKEEFDMMAAPSCILGLSLGNFWKVVGRDDDDGGSTKELTMRQAVNMGFQTSVDGGFTRDGIEFGDLQRMWSYQIENRVGIFHVVPRGFQEAH